MIKKDSNLRKRYEPFPNQYGYFSEDGREFIINSPETPRPWTNIISNGNYGLSISQAGGGFSWLTHVNLNRITRWNQDLIRDDWGKWLYLRDIDNGDFFSLAYQPVQASFKKYQVKHGLGYTQFIQDFQYFRSEWTLFAALTDPLEIWICTINNISRRTKNFQLVSYFEWNLGAAPDSHREFHKIFIETSFDKKLNSLLATKYLWEVPTDRGHWNTEWPYLAFFTSGNKADDWDTSKDSLIGRLGSFQNPRGIKSGQFTRSSGRFLDAASSLAINIQLQAGETKSIVFLLGAIPFDHNYPDTSLISTYIQKYAGIKNAKRELNIVQKYWDRLIKQVQVKTPDASFDLLTNVWLKYQVISGHLSARTGYYQQSGAYGYRDQLQSSQIWLLLEPQRMLVQAKLNAKHQFHNGTVLHWWHPLTEKGLPTRMTDDLLWLPYMLSRYFDEVGDFSALLEKVPFYDQGEATLQDHCLRAIQVVLDRFSPRGLPLIGEGDWCDGFSAVGLDWKGESIWLGMFLFVILKSWAEILEKYSPYPDLPKTQLYRQRAEQLKTAINTHGWNGSWYIAATKDNGTPIGDPSQKDGKIYLMSQTWAILSGVANEERKAKVIEALTRYLENDNGFQLLAPAFRKADPEIGYITRYAPGVRENGGVYTHAATWGVMALAQAGRADDAFRIFRKLNPIVQTCENVQRYVAEPYVLPGNIDGQDSENYGRAGWTWYTGSAGWLFTIAFESICGLQATVGGLRLNPCLPAAWPRIEMRRIFRNADYHISIENPHHLSTGIKELFLNGKKIKGNIIPPQSGGIHEVKAILTGI
jgi:cellobiose phosphorylase